MILSPDQREIRRVARDFARREIAPFAAEWDRTGEVPRDLYRRMGEVGLMGMCVDPRWGGAGADFVSYCLAMEELSAADGGISNVMAANNSPVASAIEQYGTDEQKADYLAKLCSGEWIGCIHLTEPHTGSDAAAITTRAVRDGDDWILTGHKAFITAGSLADVAMITAVTDPDAGRAGISVFVTPTDNPGYRVIAKERKLGHRTNDTCQIAFDEMRVPDRDLLGEAGKGLAIVLGKLSVGRVGVAAQSVGGARAAWRAAYDYAHERETFGKPIVGHQAIAFRLAEMATEIEAARQMYLHAAVLEDAYRAGDPGASTSGLDPRAGAASMAKLYASEMAERVASGAIQIHGGYGFLNDYPVEKIYRDVRVYQIYEGTSEVQKLVISRLLDDFDAL